MPTPTDPFLYIRSRSRSPCFLLPHYQPPSVKMSVPPAAFAAYAARDAEWACLLAILTDECSNQALLLPLPRDAPECVEWAGRVQAALVSFASSSFACSADPRLGCCRDFLRRSARPGSSPARTCGDTGACHCVGLCSSSRDASCCFRPCPLTSARCPPGSGPLHSTSRPC